MTLSGADFDNIGGGANADDSLLNSLEVAAGISNTEWMELCATRLIADSVDTDLSSKVAHVEVNEEAQRKKFILELIESGINVLRIYNGFYGAVKQKDGSIRVGGLELHIQRLDRELAKNYPITIHVVHSSHKEMESRTISEEGWLGKVVTHPVKNFGRFHIENGLLIKELIERHNIDVVNYHNADGSSLSREILKNSSGVGFATSFHSQPKNYSLKKPPKFLKTDMFIGLYILCRYIKREGFIKGVGFFLRDVRNRLQARGENKLHAKREYYKSVVSRNQTPYKSFSLLSVSEEGRKEFDELGPTVSMGNPVDTEFFNPKNVSEDRKLEIRKELGIKADEIFCVYHSRFSDMKGQALLPEIMKLVSKMTDRSFKVVLIGHETDPGWRKKVQNEVLAKGLKDNFVLLEAKEHDEIRDILATADIALFPSKSEGLPGTAVEMSLMELPVVAHSVGGVPEVVSSKETGYLVELGDIQSFALAVAKLCNSSNLRERMGSYGRAQCVEKFSLSHIAKRYMELVYLPMALGKRKKESIKPAQA